MCEIAIGTDTGGSTRIPAALCGVVGYKPSKWRVPTAGAFPLSYTLDSVGPLARTVADCARADAVMAGEEPVALQPAEVAGLRLGIPRGKALHALDATVAAAFDEAVKRLGAGGARVTDIPTFPLEDMIAANRKGGFAASEAYAIHRARLATRGDDFDPFVRPRIERGGEMTAADYIELVRTRTALVRQMDAQLADIDALIMPTTPIVAPTIAEVSTAEGFGPRNVALLSNTSIGNFFDLCAISIPIPVSGLPVGLMLLARNGNDKQLFRIAAGVERLFG
jgi:aspartyl-tRNA(Asn)/glutamyl-tRNA(Gln) amidotransferase subunit A